MTFDWAPTRVRQGFSDLRDGAIDFLIHEGEMDEHAADFLAAPLYDDPYITLARCAQADEDQDPSESAFLAAEHILPAPSLPGAAALEAHWARHQMVPAKLTRASSPIAGLLLAQRSGAYVTLPRSALAATAGLLAFREIEQPFPSLSATYRLIWHRRHERDECHGWLRQQIVAHCHAVEAGEPA